MPMNENINIQYNDWGATLKIKDGNKLADPEILNMVKSMINQLRHVDKKRLLIFGMENIALKETVDLYQEIDLFEKLGGNGFKVAFVAPHRVNDEHAKFAELVGVNRGILIKYLASEKEAILWLMS